MTSLVELRVLEGPNLYFPRAAIKLTLDVSAITGADDESVLRLARRIGVRTTTPGAPGSGFRQRFAMRVVERLVRAVARESGTLRLGVRVRPTSDPEQVVVAYPWRRRDRARAMGEAVASVIDALTSPDIEGAVGNAAAAVAATDPGAKPTTIKPKIPVVAVTGTNGKTTTSRMIAHIARADGRLTGWSNTDGIYVDGEQVEAGDYSGPSGAGRVLAHKEVEFAVTETARGGILLKGIGLTRNDVSVVTNVSADHLGMHGIDTLDQLAEVKSVVARITRSDGWCVLNADDPRVLAMRRVVKAQPWLFTRDPHAPAVRDILVDGGCATTVVDGWITILRPGAEPDPLVGLAEVPMTLAGLSRFNVENALAAATACLAVGIARESVIEGLQTFLPDSEHNPGRMNLFSLPGDVTVVIDLAHNEVGLEALLEIMNGVRRDDARLLLGMGAVGDRSAELIGAIGEIAAKGSDVVAIAHKQRYLRDRTMDEIDQLLRAGAERVGVTEIESHPTEVECLEALVEQARAGDVIGLMCHAELRQVVEWMTSHGGTPDTTETLAGKVRVNTD